MANNKKDEFQIKERRFSELAKALSHPARIAVLKTLAGKQTCVCGEIVDVIPLSQSTVSQHLKELKEAGLIKGEIEGQRSCYCLNQECIEELKELFEELIHEVEQSGPSCCS